MWVALHSVYPMRIGLDEIDREKITREDLLDRIFDDAAGFYEERETEWGAELARSVERFITLQVLDTRWREHLDNVDYLRQGIGLRGYAQKDPLVEYKLEAELMFGEMDMLVKQEVVRVPHARRGAGRGDAAARPARSARRAWTTSMPTPRRSRRSPPAPARPTSTTSPSRTASPSSSSASSTPSATVGRNDPCWCGSGKKFKRCHGA